MKSIYTIQPLEEETLTLEAIILGEQITTYYQPIVNLRSGDILGYEALSRGPEQTQFYSPMALIEEAKEQNMTWELEMLFRKKALERLHEIHQDKLFFIDVDPDIIKTQAFRSGLTKEYLDSVGGEEKSIVFEITERTAIHDYDAFLQVLENYRTQGYQTWGSCRSRFFLQKPSSTFHELTPEILTRIRDYNKISHNLNEYSKEYHFISNLITSHEA